MNKRKAVRTGIRLLHRIMDGLLRAAFLTLAVIGLWTVADTVRIYRNADSARIRPYENSARTSETQKSVSPDCIGWLVIDGTNIDYPVMQGENNTEYLNRDPYGNYSLSGSVFADARNRPDFTDAYTILYGHHMSYGYLFGALDRYSDRQYFEKHRKGTLTAGDRIFDLTVFAYLVCDAAEQRIFDPEETGQAGFIRDHAVFLAEQEEGPIVVMTTCRSPGTTERTVVAGTIKERK